MWHILGQHSSARGAVFSGFSRCCPHLPVQVITGGHYDVDCYVEDPNGRTIYRETKKQYDSFPHHAELTGIYTFCFSNEFSTFSHKTVYFNLQVGDEPPILPDMSSRVTALTQVCCSMWPNAQPRATALAPFPSAEGRSACWWQSGAAVPGWGAEPSLSRVVSRCPPGSGAAPWSRAASAEPAARPSPCPSRAWWVALHPCAPRWSLPASPSTRR